MRYVYQSFLRTGLLKTKLLLVLEHFFYKAKQVIAFSSMFYENFFFKITFFGGGTNSRAFT